MALSPSKSSLVRPAVALTVWFVVGFGLLFPAVIWGLSQALFPHQANGSLIRDGKGSVVGSELLGQNFGGSKYFHPRPSAAGSGYDAANSSGSNLGPTSDKLINGIADDPATKDVDESYAGVKQLAAAYRLENGLAEDALVPVDAVTRSASGLDPHISVRNAEIQASRVAKARGLDVNVVLDAVRRHTEGRFVGVFGEPRVNVLLLNLDLDGKAQG